MLRKFLILVSIAICGFGLLFRVVPVFANLADDYHDFPSDINLFDPGDTSDANNGGGGNGGGGNGGGGGGGGTLDRPECNDGKDNDGDGEIDYPADSDCTSPYDDSESGSKGGKTIATLNRPACADGIDNDGDGFVDYGHDIGCESWTDDDETNAVEEKTPTKKPTLPSTGPADTLFLALLVAGTATYLTKVRKHKLQS